MRETTEYYRGKLQVIDRMFCMNEQPSALYRTDSVVDPIVKALADFYKQDMGDLLLHVEQEPMREAQVEAANQGEVFWKRLVCKCDCDNPSPAIVDHGSTEHYIGMECCQCGHHFAIERPKKG